MRGTLRHPRLVRIWSIRIEFREERQGYGNRDNHITRGEATHRCTWKCLLSPLGDLSVKLVVQSLLFFLQVLVSVLSIYTIMRTPMMVSCNHCVTFHHGNASVALLVIGVTVLGDIEHASGPAR